MLRLAPTESDDIDFLSHIERIINGAIAVLAIHDVFVVHVDSWFDHKWLGWRSGSTLRVPTFTPNRIRSERRFLRDDAHDAWTPVGIKKPLHILQPGRTHLAQPLDRFSDEAGFIWYSGSTATNTMGSLMFYRSGADERAWHASLQKKIEWAITEQCRISRDELLGFEGHGRRLESRSGRHSGD
ncbi:MAG TPA: hypothetical protein VGP63_13805 [Planctomycetaceae bacterium]|jgi:hypothetical protein|nr:hypothetical protein [Planctomycetaceae bacterium]